MARLEARRRATWNIFTALEYAGEQDQLKLYNFFNEIITAMVSSQDNTSEKGSRFNQGRFVFFIYKYINLVLAQYSTPTDEDENDKKLLEATDPANFKVDKSYKGPFLSLPFKSAHVEMMIEHFKANKVRILYN